MNKIIIGDHILNSDKIALEFEKLNSSFVNENNKKREIYITISKSISAYNFLNSILNNLENVTIIVYKIENINLKKIENKYIEIINKIPENNENIYRKLIYTLIYDNNSNNKYEILNSLNIHYVSKLLSMSYLNEITEQIMGIENYIYKVNNKSIITLYSLINYKPLDNLLNFPEKKEKVVEIKDDKKQFLKNNNSTTKLILKQINKNKNTLF